MAGPLDPKALAVLRQQFGLGDLQDGDVPQGPSPMTGETLDLNNLRNERLSEMEHAATPNLGGNGRPPSPTAPFTSYGATMGDFLGLQHDAASDPYTGDAAHARVAGIQSAHDQADLAMTPDIRRAKEQSITDTGNTAEANAEGPFRAQNSAAGRAATKFTTDEGIRKLAAQFGLQGEGEVDSAPVHQTPEGVNWIDGSAMDKKGLPAAMKRAADQGTRIVTDKQTVQQLQDVDAADRTLKYVGDQIASKLPPDFASRPTAYAKNTLAQIFQTDENLTAFYRTLQPLALQVYRTAGGMRGAGGMRMGPQIAQIAQGIMPKSSDTVGTMHAILNDLHQGLTSIRQGALSGTVRGQASGQPQVASPDGATHVTTDAAGNIVPWVPPSR